MNFRNLRWSLNSPNACVPKSSCPDRRKGEASGYIRNVSILLSLIIMYLFITPPVLNLFYLPYILNTCSNKLVFSVEMDILNTKITALHLIFSGNIKLYYDNNNRIYIHVYVYVRSILFRCSDISYIGAILPWEFFNPASLSIYTWMTEPVLFNIICYINSACLVG